MDLKSGIDKFGLNPKDINDLYDEDKAAATGMLGGSCCSDRG